MKNIFKFVVLLLFMSCGLALAHSYKQGDIRIGHIWARATPSGATTAAIYLPLLNTGTVPDKLIGVSSPDASAIQIHDETKENGISKMITLDSVDLEPNKPVTFQPSGKHLMVIGLKHALKAGDMFPLTLKFEKAGQIDVKAMVEGIAASSGHDH